jgi:hypothetical protein
VLAGAAGARTRQQAFQDVGHLVSRVAFLKEARLVHLFELGGHLGDRRVALTTQEAQILDELSIVIRIQLVVAHTAAAIVLGKTASIRRSFAGQRRGSFAAEEPPV